MLLLIMLYYQKCNCQPLIISNWNNGKFSSYLEVENFQAFFCLCPPPFLLSPRAKKIFRARFARAKNFFLSPQSSGSRTGGYLLSCPTLCKHWRLDFLSQPPFFSNFSIPAALAAHRYSWPPMIRKWWSWEVSMIFREWWSWEVDMKKYWSSPFHL